MNTLTATEKLSETDFLSFFTDHAVENNFSLALWKLPNQITRHVILSQQHQILRSDQLVEELPTGFIFSPFDPEKERIFLPADFSFSFENNALKSSESPEESRSLAWLQEQKVKASPARRHKPRYNYTGVYSTEKEYFTELVEKGIKKIEEGDVEKIVPYRFKIISLPVNFDVVEAFQKLCSTYPNALVSFVSVPGIGSWLGASPELLASVENKTIFKTVALAGTKPYNNSINLKSVAWTQKEIEEQALVERYIISCFKKIRLREYDEHGPKTIVAGNLMHLRSEFTVDMLATNFPQLGSTMLKLLHPTSAVCGMPLDNALDFIRKNEKYTREFYAGYLGPVNYHNSINIFVNIRCTQLLDSDAIFYAGAGVTADSVPEEEWAETEIKLHTLLNVIV